jgi:hypothetical protein
MNAKNKKLLPAVGIALIVVLVGYFVLNTPDQRTAGDKIGDAINELEKGGPEKAMRQLQDRTTGEKIEDAASDAKDDIKRAID